MELQGLIKLQAKSAREYIIRKIKRLEDMFGSDSEQVSGCVEELNKFDDAQLKIRANKYKEFLLINNEKPTKAFCLLGKENNLLDDMDQIKDSEGRDFSNKDERKEYIRKYYENLYKKKLDNLIKVEDFLGNDTANCDWVNDKKLNNMERDELEGQITLGELENALKSSNQGCQMAVITATFQKSGRFKS